MILRGAVAAPEALLGAGPRGGKSERIILPPQFRRRQGKMILLHLPLPHREQGHA